jgi:hypothetical protein
MSFVCTIAARRHDTPRNRAWQDRTAVKQVGLLTLVSDRRERDRLTNRITQMRSDCHGGRSSIFKIVCGDVTSTTAFAIHHHCHYIDVAEFSVRRDLRDLLAGLSSIVQSQSQCLRDTLMP